MDSKPTITLEATVVKTVNTIFQQSGQTAVRTLTIHNGENIPIKEATLKIETETYLAVSYQETIPYIPPRQSVTLKEIPFRFQLEALASLAERAYDTIKISLLSKEGEVLADCTHPIEALAHNEWQGLLCFPELLSSFVTPNCPETAVILDRASELLGGQSKKSAWEGYQNSSPSRILQQAAAIYAALQEQNISCIVPFENFEETGQRISLYETIMQQREGFSLDLALFYAGCLESACLNPLLILKKRHIFVGFWLEEYCFSEIVQDDPSCIASQLVGDSAKIAVVECTSFAAGKTVDFESAEKMAVQEFSSGEPVEAVIVLKRARLSHISSLPRTVYTESGWKIQPEKQEQLSLVPISQSVAETAPPKNESIANLIFLAKKAEWESRLLDLSLYSPLLNLCPSPVLLPVLVSSLAALEEALVDGGEFVFLPRPPEWRPYKDGYDMESFHLLGLCEERVRTEFQNSRLYSALGEQELEQAALSLYLDSRSSLEESAENTLYLALGLLRWYENSASEKACYAPVILLPAEKVGRS